MAKTEQHKIVLLETDRSRLQYLRSMLTGWGYLPFIFDNETNCLTNLAPLNADLVISSSLPANRALRFINSLTMIKATVPVLFLTGDHELLDYVDTNGFSHVKVIRSNIVPALIRKAIRSSLEIDSRDGNRHIGPLLIGNSPEMVKLKKSIPDISRSDEPIILTGEPGTGKELFARAIHSQSGRKDQHFVKINALTLPFKLLEEELFGYGNGPLLKYARHEKGIFGFARMGSLFIKEIGALPVSLQARLLQITPDSDPTAVGAGQVNTSNTRIMVSTSENPSLLLKRGKLRNDLYYRLSVINVNMPVLRHRIQDIPALTDFFIDKYRLHYSRNAFHLSEKTRKMLLIYSWPGNIKQLEQLIELAVMQGTDEGIFNQLERDLNNASGFQAIRHTEPGIIPGSENIHAFLHKTDDLSLKSVRQKFMDRSEKEIINRALEITGWNRKKTAGMLDISYKSLLNKMKAFML